MKEIIEQHALFLYVFLMYFLHISKDVVFA